MTNRSELALLMAQIKDNWDGDPWFGRPALQLLDGITEGEAYSQLAGQHSIAELVWHMVTWRVFVLSRLQQEDGRSPDYFEVNDWREVGPQTNTWQDGLAQLHKTQAAILQALKECDDKILEVPVKDRQYDFRKLLHGIVQHDIYHLGQIAYLRKLLAAEKR